MQCKQTSLSGVVELFPDLFPDTRGEFLVSYNEQSLGECGITVPFIQDNLSVSKKGVLRGLHFQTGSFAQDKLVSVISGQVFDVAVDLRRDSPTYKQWVSVILDGETHNMLFIPKGLAHGFYVLSEEARFFYKCSNYYDKDSSTGIVWDDPTLAIAWPIPPGDTPILSEQDSSLPGLTA